MLRWYAHLGKNVTLVLASNNIVSPVEETGSRIQARGLDRFSWLLDESGIAKSQNSQVAEGPGRGMLMSWWNDHVAEKTIEWKVCTI